MLIHRSHACRRTRSKGAAQDGHAREGFGESLADGSGKPGSRFMRLTMEIVGRSFLTSAVTFSANFADVL